MKIQEASSYKYLSRSGCFHAEGIDDSFQFSQVQGAMSTLGMTRYEQDSIIQTLSAILLLGNLEFAIMYFTFFLLALSLSFLTYSLRHEEGKPTSRSRITNSDVLSTISQLLGIPPSTVEKILCERVISARYIEFCTENS